MFLAPTLTIGASITSRLDFIEGSDPETLDTRFAEYLAALIVENTARTGQQLLPFNVSDVQLAGSGDGYSFTLQILVTTAVPGTAEGWLAGSLTDVVSAFWMASTAEALALAAAPALASISGNDLTNVAICHAGASKGLRYMGFAGGVAVLT